MKNAERLGGVLGITSAFPLLMAVTSVAPPKMFTKDQSFFHADNRQ